MANPAEAAAAPAPEPEPAPAAAAAAAAPHDKPYHENPIPTINEAILHINHHSHLSRFINRKLAEDPIDGDIPLQKYYYRWDTRNNLHKTGITGSDSWIRIEDGKEYLSALTNPTFGENTVYVANGWKGARGFLESEMRRDYLKSKKQPTQEKTYYLYRISPPEGTRHINLEMFNPPDKRGGYTTDEEYLNTPDSSNDLDLRQNLRRLGALTLQQQKELVEYLEHENGIGSKKSYQRRGKQIPVKIYQEMPDKSVKDKLKFLHIQAMTPKDRKAYYQSLTRQQRAELPPLKDFDKYKATDREIRLLGGWARHQNSDRAHRLSIMVGNARLTQESQLEGPILPHYIEPIDSYTLKPEDWPNFADWRERRLRTLKEQPLPPDQTIVDKIMRAENNPDSVFV